VRGVSLSGLLESQRVQSEVEEFKRWVRQYGLFAFSYEQSKIVTRTAWLARVMLDEGYRMFPGREEELRGFVASEIVKLVEELGIPREAVVRGDLHGTRSDVLNVLLEVYPNVQQTDRPSLARILEAEVEAGRQAKPAVVAVSPLSPRGGGDVRYLLALLAVFLASAAIVVLLSFL